MQLPSLSTPPTYMHPCLPAQFPVSNDVLPLSTYSTLHYRTMYVDSPSPLLFDITASIAAGVGREHETPALLSLHPYVCNLSQEVIVHHGQPCQAISRSD